MSTEPPPLVKPFRLPLAAWIAWGLYAVLISVLFVIQRTPPSAYAIGELLGRIVGSLILPTLFAWIAWRIARRAASATTVTFFVVFGLTLVGQLVQFGRKMQSAVALQKISAESRKLVADQREATARGQPIDNAKSERLAQQAAEQMQRVAQNSSGQDRAAAEAGKAYLDKLLATKKRYDAALAKLRPDTFWQAERYDTPQAIIDQRSAVKEFAEANRDLSALQDTNGAGLRTELERQGLPADLVNASIAAYKSSAGTRIAVIARIRESDDEFATTMSGFLDLLEANFGRWKNADGKLVFDDDAASRRHQELLDQVKAIATKQAECQRELTGAGK